MLPELEKGDVIITKDGREMRILSVYKPDGQVKRVDCVEEKSENPMRTPIFSENIGRILRKGPKLSPQPELKIPDGQIVQDKEPVAAGVVADVASREKQPTASAEAKRKAEGVKK